MMKVIALAAALMLPISAHAETLLCIDEAAGGVKFFGGEWKGTRFGPPGKSRYIVSPSKNDPLAYEVKEMGQTYVAHRCNRTLYEGAPSEQMVCGGIGYGMIINFRLLRYTEIYTFGYIEDDRSGSNTPYVSAGKCSVITP